MYKILYLELIIDHYNDNLKSKNKKEKKVLISYYLPTVNVLKIVPCKKGNKGRNVYV